MKGVKLCTNNIISGTANSYSLCTSHYRLGSQWDYELNIMPWINQELSYIWKRILLDCKLHFTLAVELL